MSKRKNWYEKKLTVHVRFATRDFEFTATKLLGGIKNDVCDLKH